MYVYYGALLLTSYQSKFNMRGLCMFLISISFCYCALVLEVPFDENDPTKKTTLTLDKDIEFMNPITICIRFYLTGFVSPRYIFSGHDR